MDINSLALQITNFVTLAVANAGGLLWNFLVLVVLTVAIVLFSYKTGRGGIISLVLAFYAGYAIYLVFPYDHQVISYGTTTLSRAIISIGLYIAACIVPFVFSQRLTHGGIGIISAVPRFVVSFLTAAFIIAIAYHVFGVNHLYSFPKPLDQLFAPDQYFFWWFIAPIVGMYFLVH